MPQSVTRAEFFDEMAVVSRKLRGIFDARVKKRGLTLPRARVLFILARRNHISQRELADEMDLETPTIVRLLDAMEKQGFLERRSESTDRRVNQVVLSEFGRKLAGEIQALLDELREQVASDVDDADVVSALKVIRALGAGVQKIGKV